MLVVDDDVVVRSMLVRVLRTAGYVAEAVGSGEEALAAIGGGGFALVLSDIHLPGMGGVELAATLASRAIDVPVLLLTGLEPEQVQDAIAELGLVRAVLHKPFRGAALLAAVRAATPAAAS